jgi:thioredoxin 1
MLSQKWSVTIRTFSVVIIRIIQVAKNRNAPTNTHRGEVPDFLAYIRWRVSEHEVASRKHEMVSSSSMNDGQSVLPPSPEPASRPERGWLLWLWQWFWRVNLVLALVVYLPYAWYCFYVPSNAIAWADNYSSARLQSAQSGKPIILFFTGKWCVPCRIMKRNVWADEKVTASVNAGFIPLTIDVDDPDTAETLSRYRVGATPTTIITDPDGKVLQRVDGAMGKTDFLELLGKRISSDPAPPLSSTIEEVISSKK